ncbi:SMI1/KNR4 family protein [Catellatospora bangladeshensis]|uniref:SMI1/KNR4 family protein n=1 Tax=Catellatospora bangladeshensis TaxID=310355 RepID=UPI00360A937B
MDAYRRRWGYGEGSRVTAEQLDQLEARLGLPLPEEYRAFLIRFGTGGFDLLTPERVLHKSQCDYGGWNHVTLPFALADGHGLSCCRDDQLLNGTVVITEGGCAFYTVLAVTSVSAGTVWCNDYAPPGSDDEFCWAPRVSHSRTRCRRSASCPGSSRS